MDLSLLALEAQLVAEVVQYDKDEPEMLQPFLDIEKHGLEDAVGEEEIKKMRIMREAGEAARVKLADTRARLQEARAPLV